MKKFIVLMNGKEFATFSEETWGDKAYDHADAYVKMQESKTKTPKRDPAFAAQQIWTIKEEG